MIDSRIEIWVGGAAFNQDTELPSGIELLDGLHGVEQALARWDRLIKDPAGTS
jgi:hypothetical protein